jgi:hypothetical protein
MAGATLATVAGILKEVYEPGVRYQLNDDTIALKRIVKTDANVKSEVGGKYVTFPIHYKRNPGIGARRENETLPTAGNQGTTSARVGLKYEYGALQLTGQTMELVNTNYQAFADATDLELDKIKDDLAKDQNRQVYGNGTGAIATTSTAAASTTPLITSGIAQLQIGEILDVYTPANLAADSTPKIAGITVTNIDIPSGVVTMDTSVTYAAGDIFVRTGNANREWTGLGAIVQNSGILYNIDPASFPIWKAVVDSNSGTGRPISEGLILKNVDAVRTNGAKTSLLLTSLGVRRSYFNLLVQQRTYVGTKEFTGGFTGLAFTTDQGDIPLISDVDSPPGTILGLSEKNIKVYREADWSFMDRDGNMWDRVPGKDAYASMLYQYSELGTDRRNAHFRMSDIVEAS